MTITYESLFEILRKEKNQEDLQKIDDSFFSDVKNYIDDKNKALHEKPRLEQFTEENEQNALRTQLKSALKLIREIINRRQRKIIEIAMNKAENGSNIINTNSLLPEEKVFFDHQVEVIGNFRASLLDSMHRPNTAPKPQDLNMAPHEPNTSDLKVQILESVPKFVGVDLEIYGPYMAQETIALKPEIADMLIKTNKAKII